MSELTARVRQGPVVGNEFTQKLVNRPARYAINYQFVFAPIQEQRSGLRIVETKRFQCPQVFRIDVGSIFHLYGVEMTFAIDDKIDFRTTLGAPEEALYVAAAVFTPGFEMLHHQTFQGNAVDFRDAVKGAFGPQMLKYTSIKQIKFVMRGDCPPGASGKYRKRISEQQVFQD